jgi:iron complex outermembrane recepter protein
MCACRLPTERHAAEGSKAQLRYSSWDLRAAYTWQKMKAALGVNNLTNRMPPRAPRTFTDNNADVATYSPIGRLVYATVAVTL